MGPALASARHSLCAAQVNLDPDSAYDENDDPASQTYGSSEFGLSLSRDFSAIGFR